MKALYQSLANDPKTLHFRFPQIGEPSACSLCKAPSDIEKLGKFTRAEPVPCQPGGGVVCVTCTIDYPTIHEYMRELRAPFEKEIKADQEKEAWEKKAKEDADKAHAQAEAEREAERKALRAKLAQLV